MKQNNGIKAVKRKDVLSHAGKRLNSKGYVDAIAALEAGGDGVFLPTNQRSATILGYQSAARLSGIRYSVHTAEGGVIVTRES